jgi:hypothetical protein
LENWSVRLCDILVRGRFDPKADKHGCGWIVREVPIADIAETFEMKKAAS